METCDIIENHPNVKKVYLIFQLSVIDIKEIVRELYSYYMMPYDPQKRCEKVPDKLRKFVKPQK